MTITKTTVLTNEAKRLIAKNYKLRLAIADRWETYTYETMKRWFRLNDPRLTHPDTLALICAYEKCEPDQLTEVIDLQPAIV